jgi:hypothetical protein
VPGVDPFGGAGEHARLRSSSGPAGSRRGSAWAPPGEQARGRRALAVRRIPRGPREGPSSSALTVADRTEHMPTSVGTGGRSSVAGRSLQAGRARGRGASGPPSVAHRSLLGRSSVARARRRWRITRHRIGGFDPIANSGGAENASDPLGKETRRIAHPCVPWLCAFLAVAPAPVVGGQADAGRHIGHVRLTLEVDVGPRDRQAARVLAARPAWRHKVATSGLAPFGALVNGLAADRAAVEAALRTSWSTGPVERHVHHVKDRWERSPPVAQPALNRRFADLGHAGSHRS